MPREPSRIAQFAREDVHGEAALRQRPDDPAGPAADIEHGAFTGDQLGDVAISAPLPIALEKDRTVMRACVIVAAPDRVPQLPQPPECAQVRQTEPDDARVRAAVPPRLIVEWHLL